MSADSPPVASTAPSGGGLRASVLRGGALTLVEFVTRQLLRLASNLILTRLLFPEAFGLMALVTAFMTALELLSDFGIQPAIVNSRRADDSAFLDTAWTLQVLRGLLLLLAACAVAWPAAQYYGEPQLWGLIAVTGLNAVFAGLLPIRYTLCTRNLQLGRLAGIHLTAQLAALCAMIAAAWVFRSVWALVAGGLLTQLGVLVLSHVWLEGRRDRLRLERGALLELVGFGKWIVLSTALHFLATHGDRFINGAHMSMERLGVYAIALYLSEAIWRLVAQGSQRVLFPALSRLVREAPERVRSAYLRARGAVDAAVMPACGFLFASGGLIIDALYDPRYAAAGWMLEILAVRTALQCAVTPAGVCLLAHGDPRYGTAQGAVRAVWVCVGMPLAWAHLGIQGAVWTFALANLPAVAIGWYGLARYGLLSLPRELLPIGFLAVGYALGVGVESLLR